MALLTGMIFSQGCNRSPAERVQDASGGGALGRFGVASAFIIFDDELASGGGAFFYPGGENQNLSFNDTSNSISRRSIRYSWNGLPVSNLGCMPDPTHNFAGFDLMHVPQQSAYLGTPGRDLRKAGYTRATFYARGSLSTNTVLKIEVASPGSVGCAALPAPCLTLSTNGTDDDGSGLCSHASFTSNWQHYAIPISNPSLGSVKDFFKATLIFTDPFVGNQAPGQGGTVYFDAIGYVP